jgi:hypothetical protein
MMRASRGDLATQQPATWFFSSAKRRAKTICLGTSPLSSSTATISSSSSSSASCVATVTFLVIPIFFNPTTRQNTQGKCFRSAHGGLVTGPGILDGPVCLTLVFTLLRSTLKLRDARHSTPELVLEEPASTRGASRGVCRVVAFVTAPGDLEEMDLIGARCEPKGCAAGLTVERLRKREGVAGDTSRAIENV